MSEYKKIAVILFSNWKLFVSYVFKINLFIDDFIMFLVNRKVVTKGEQQSIKNNDEDFFKIKVGKHFKLYEFFRSKIAITHNIDNKTKNQSVIENIMLLTEHCLDPIRENFDKPVYITSGYRCPKVNKLAEGTSTSEHLIGRASDIVVEGVDIKELFEWCKTNLKFNQLILETPKKGNSWVHISYREHGNKNEVKLM